MRRVAAALVLAMLALPAGGETRCFDGGGCVKRLTLDSERAEDTPNGPRFLSVAPAPPVVEPGDIVPEGYQMMTNTRFYGLPPVRDGWVYYRIERDVYRVDYATREVLEKVTHWANARFP